VTAEIVGITALPHLIIRVAQRCTMICPKSSEKVAVMTLPAVWRMKQPMKRPGQIGGLSEDGFQQIGHSLSTQGTSSYSTRLSGIGIKAPGYSPESDAG